MMTNYIVFVSLTGLFLTLNINQDDYVHQAGDTAGVRLVIHSQTQMPFPEDEGVTIEPGFSTSVGIKKVRHLCTEPNDKFKNKSLSVNLFKT